MSLSTLSTPSDNPIIEDPVERLIQSALFDIRASGLNSRGLPIFSLRRAAEKHGVGVGMLTGRYNGRKTRVKSHEHQQLLTPSQELVLVAWIKSVGHRGVPLTYASAAEYASLVANKPVSTKWVQLFRNRHPDLTVRWTSGLEACRT